MLLPFDLKADREGWTVLDVTTEMPALLDGLRLTGLCLEDAEQTVNALNALEIRCQLLEDAEQTVNALNALEIRCQKTARRKVLGELTSSGAEWQSRASGIDSRNKHSIAGRQI